MQKGDLLWPKGLKPGCINCSETLIGVIKTKIAAFNMLPLPLQATNEVQLTCAV